MQELPDRFQAVVERLIERVDEVILSSFRTAVFEHDVPTIQECRAELIGIFGVIIQYWHTLAENAALRYVSEYSKLPPQVLKGQDPLLCYAFLSRQPELFPIA
jgi:hypothetical protein